MHARPFPPSGVPLSYVARSKTSMLHSETLLSTGILKKSGLEGKTSKNDLFVAHLLAALVEAADIPAR